MVDVWDAERVIWVCDYTGGPLFLPRTIYYIEVSRAAFPKAVWLSPLSGGATLHQMDAFPPGQKIRLPCELTAQLDNEWVKC